MKITGTKHYIKVEFEGKVCIINGELTTTPAFYAEADSIKHWEAPFQHILITEKEKQDLITQIISEAEKKGLKIFFE